MSNFNHLRKNMIGALNGTRSFESFEPATEAQKTAKDRLLVYAEKLKSLENPTSSFLRPQLFSLCGEPGRGKTHLIEAFVQELLKNPQTKECVWLSRGNFYYENQTGVFDYGNKPLVILDDLFSDKHAISELHPRVEGQALMDFFLMVYEENRTIITTSNFPFQEGILDFIKSIDKVGRVTSRLQEMLKNSTEITLDGPDHRLVGSTATHGTFI